MQSDQMVDLASQLAIAKKIVLYFFFFFFWVIFYHFHELS